MGINPSIPGVKAHRRSSIQKKTAWMAIVLFLVSSVILIAPNLSHAAHPIAFTKTGPASANIGDTITYTFKVEHAAWGPENYTSVKVKDPMFGSGWSKDLGTITPGQTKTFTQEYTVKATDPDPLTNTATCSGLYGGFPSPYTANCSVDIKGRPFPALKVSKTGPLDALVYETITYTIAVMNTGNVPLDDVTVVDSLISDFEWKVGNLGVGKGDYIHVKYTVTPDSPYPLRNVAFGIGTSPQGWTVNDKSEWTTKAPGLFGYQFMPNATTRDSYTTYTGVMNPGEQPANSSVVSDSTDGTPYTQSNTIPPYSRGTFSTADATGIPFGDYATHIESDQPVVGSQVVIGTYNGQIPGAYAYSGVSSGTRFYLPNICTRDGYHSFQSVQNLGTEDANVNVTYYPSSSDIAAGSHAQGAVVAPGARNTFSAADTPGMPAGDYSAVVASDQPVVASQSTFCLCEGKWQCPVAYGSSGINHLYSGTTPVYIPNICTQQGYSSYTAVQTVGGKSADVKITYYDNKGQSSGEQNATIPADSRYTFIDNDTPGMPAGDYSAVMTSDEPIVASNSTFGNFKGQGVVAYGTNGVDAQQVGMTNYLPNIYTQTGNYSYSQVQNVGSETANVTATYRSTDGTSYEQKVSVPRNARYTFAAEDVPGMPPGEYSLVLTSDQPVVASNSSFGRWDFSVAGNHTIQKTVGYGTEATAR